MQFEIIDMARLQNEQRPLIAQAYGMWRETYAPILKAAGESLMADHFYRAKIMNVIHTDGRIHSFSLNNVLDLALPGLPELGYFAEMPPTLLKSFVASETRLFTIEWVTVHPELRGKMTKIQQADLIMGLSIREMTHTHCDGAIGYSRIDLGADRIASRFGARPQEQITAHGIACNVMLARREWVTPHKYAVVQKAVDDLWNSKTNHTSLIQEGTVYENAA